MTENWRSDIQLRRLLAGALVLALAGDALAASDEIRPVPTAGGGFGGIEDNRTCEATGPCYQLAVQGPTALLAGGVEMAARPG